MVDDGKKPDRTKLMEDRTVPMPVPRGGTLSADTIEADEGSFIGADRLAPASRALSTSAPAPPAPRTTQPTPSFDEEIARNRAPAPRPATVVRRSPLASAHLSSVGPEGAGAQSDPSGATPSSVFASREPVEPKAEPQDGEDQAPTVPLAWPRPPESAAPSTLPQATAVAFQSAPVAMAADSDAGPTVQLVVNDVTAAQGSVESDSVENGSAVIGAASDELPGDPLRAPTVPAPVGNLPDRVKPSDRERLANEATRIKTNPSTPLGDPQRSGGGRGLKSVLLLLGVSLAAAGSWAGVRSLRGDEQPSVAQAVPAARSPVLSAALPSQTQGSAAAPAQPSSEEPPAAVEAVAPQLMPPPTPAMPAGGPMRPGFFDVSGSGALGLAPALAASVTPAIRRVAARGLAVRGEIRAAVVARGEASVECGLTVVDARARRVTLHASARANDRGQKADRLLRLASERCGQNLAPDLEQALALVAQK